MLDSMRALSKSVVSKLLMLLLIVSFGVWGVGDILRDGGPSYAAKVGGETISLREFEQQRGLFKRQLETMGMQGVDPSKLSMTVIRQLVQQKLTLMAMRDMGLFVNDKLVGKTIAELPDFKDDKGRFSKEKFTTALARQQMPEQVFVGQMKKEIAGKFLSDSLNMGDATAPASVLTLEAMAAGETRDAVLLTISAKNTPGEASADDLQKYYNDNKETLYLQPESRTLDYVVLTPAEIDALVDRSITDEQIAEVAKASPAMTTPLIRLKLRGEQRDAALRALSNTVEDELAAGRTMAQAFEKAGIKTELHTLTDASAETIKTGTDDVLKTVTEQGFGLSEGEVSGLITTKKGTLLMVSAKTIKPATPKPYDVVKADVAQQVSKQRAREAARAKAISVKEALAKAPNWQAASAEFGLTSRILSNIKRPAEDKPAPNAAIPFALQQAIFERNVGEVAGPLALENGDHVVALVTQSHLPTINPAKVGDAKTNAQITVRLAQDIENRAYLSFGKRHPVKINPAVMQAEAVEVQ